MKRIFVLLALTTLVTGLLGSCKKDDIENPDPQGDKTFEEIVKDLPGVYLTADFYDELGYGRVVNLKEDGTTEQYYFFDNEVEDGVSVNEGYVMKGTWTAFKVEDISSKTGFICNLALEGDPEAEAIVDTNYIGFYNNKTYINSSYFGLNEFFKVNQSFDEFKTKENLEAFLPGHLKDTELSKIPKSTNEANAYATPPEYLSHWMRDIPDDVHLIDLSIPGSHDALSYRTISGAMTQTESIEKQFAWGSRYFDLRVYKSTFFGARVYPCHGKIRCLDLCRTVVSDMEELVYAVRPNFRNNSETAIIRIRVEGPFYETEDADFCCSWLYNNLFLTQVPGISILLSDLEQLVALYKDYFIPYRPDLTLGDVRGKIVVMYDDLGWYNYQDARSHPGYINAYPDAIDYKGRRHGGHKYTFQDECEFGAPPLFQDTFYYIDKKVSLFEEELKNNRKEIPIGSKVSNTPYNECLSFNHCSGYLTKYFPVQFSHYVYPEILKALKKEEYKRKTYGIVPMDYIGREDYILEDYALWSNIEDTFNYGSDSGTNVYWTVNTRDLIEQIVKSNDIFKN